MGRRVVTTRRYLPAATTSQLGPTDDHGNRKGQGAVVKVALD